MDFETTVAAGIIGFAVVNALALMRVLVLTRPSLRRHRDDAVWEATEALEPYPAEGQGEPTQLAA